MVLLVEQWGLLQGRKVDNMSDFLEKKNIENPLMDFVEVMFENPETITQAGIDSDAENLRLKFDGSQLSLMHGDEELLRWKGVSGKKGYQSSEFQHLKKKGPLPEGRYDVRQDEYSKMGFGSDFLGTYYPVIRRHLLPDSAPKKVGSWSGGAKSWGTQKIGLVPTGQQNMYGRSNFFIHGGLEPGSAGCIDLTSDNDSFMGLFLTLGKDLPLDVIYEKKSTNKDQLKN